MKVIELNARRQEPEVWQCQCGHFGFWLYSNGEVVCSRCETEATEMRGHWTIPPEPDATTYEPTENNVMNLFSSSETEPSLTT
jgi:hypothetical protein